MKEYFVPFEIAKKLKQLGFDEPCLACYDKCEMLSSYSSSVFEPINYNTSGFVRSAPLYDQVFNWIRKNHSLQWVITKDKYNYDYYEFHEHDIMIKCDVFKSFEMCRAELLNEMLNHLEKQNKTLNLQ